MKAKSLSSKIIPIGAFLGFLSVLFGAFGAHALKGKIGYDLLEIYQTGCHYLFLHALGIILYGLWHGIQGRDSESSIKCWPAGAFLIGIIIFTGSLFCITFTSIRSFGAITPIGGLLLMLGWLGFAIQSFRHSRS